MVTVTNADVKVRYLTDDWPAGVNDANVTALCARAETWIQSKAGTTGSFPLTSAAGVELSVDLVVNWIEYAKWLHEGQAAAGIPRPQIWTSEMDDRFNQILQEKAGLALEDTIDFNAT